MVPAGHSQHIRPSRGDITFRVINGLFLIAFAMVCVLPMWHVLMSSISNPKSLYVNTDFLFLPTGGVSFETWKIVFTKYPIVRGYLNTLLYTVLSVGIGLILSLLGAYALYKKNLLFKNLIFLFVFLPMFVNAGLIPQYVMAYRLHLTNTIWGIVLTGCCNAMNILVIKRGLDNIPLATIEAAEIDGANDFQILFRIIVPMIVPSISVIVMFGIINMWNSWLIPSIYLSQQSADLYPLALIVRNIINETSGTSNSLSINTSVEYTTSIRMVAIVMSSAPLLILFPFVQKYFEKAVILGSVKG